MERWPILGLLAEYRGQAPASDFTDRQTGARVDLAPNLRFELELPDGDVQLVAFRQTALDQACDFDSKSLKRGDRVVIDGMVVVNNGPDGRSYCRLVTMQRADAAKLRAAS